MMSAYVAETNTTGVCDNFCVSGSHAVCEFFSVHFIQWAQCTTGRQAATSLARAITASLPSAQDKGSC